MPVAVTPKSASDEPMSRRLRPWIPLVITCASVGAVGLLKVCLYWFAGFDSPILLFFSAIALSAWVGGLRQGLVATGLSVLFVGAYLHALPLLDVNLWIVRVLMLTVDGIVISLVCGRMHDASARARMFAEDARRNSQRFEKIFASNMMGIVFSDREGRIQEANEYYLNLVGASSDDLRAGRLSWRQLTTPETLPQSLEALQKVLRTGTVQPFEKEYIRPDGQRVICSVAATMVNEDQMVGFILDVTETKRTELARLSESQIFLDSVVENIPNMIFVKDAQTLRFVRFNKAGEELLGLDSDELLGRNDYDLFPREQADQFTQADREVLRGRATVDIPEEPISTPRGQRVLHTKKIPVFDQRGEPQYLLGISEDITERRHMEQQRIELMKSEMALAEAEKTMRRLGFLTEASAALNRSLDIHAMMNTFARVLTRELASTCVVDIIDESGASFDRLAVTRGSRSGFAASIDSHVVADFQKLPLDSRAVHGPVATLRHGRVQLFPHLDDPTLRLALTPCPEQGAALNRHGARSMLIVPILYGTRILGAITLLAPDGETRFGDLEVSITQDLAKRAAFAIENANLFSRANEASRTKSAFLANISHEIRTPLGAMIGFAELSLEEGGLSSGQAEFIQKIVKNGQQLLRIVNDVLDISKVESDHLQVDRIDFSLTRLLDETISLLATQAEIKGLSLKLRRQADVPEFVNTDPLRLRQILINIIGNSIKFTESGGITVDVSLLARTPENAAKLLFLIRDSGVGIDEKQARRLFEPFAQGDESMARKFGGTGLGLHLSRKLARLLGGDVELESSQPRQGSVFRVTVDVGLSAQIALTPASETTGLPPAKLSGSLLVVEDSIDNQILIQAFLGAEELRIEVANNGADALTKTADTTYDLILMDIQMPVMDGFEAIHHLRDRGYSGPVVALTAHGMKGDRERCLDHGFTDYLSKPISRQSLVECVQRNLGRVPAPKDQSSASGLESST